MMYIHLWFYYHKVYMSHMDAKYTYIGGCILP